MDDLVPEAKKAEVIDRVVAIVRRPSRLRGNTLEVFDVDAKEQRPTLKKIHEGLQEIVEGVRRMTIIFHTRGETRRLYADFVAAFPHQCNYTVEVDFDGKRKFFCDLCGGAF
jgi:hypothetical protein